VLGLDAPIFVGLIGVVLIFVGVLQIFLANSVRRHARWAYAAVLAIGLLGSVPRLLGISVPVQVSGPAQTGWWIGAWLYLVVASCAAALLVLSYIRTDADE